MSTFPQSVSLPVSVRGPRLLVHAVESLLHSTDDAFPCEADSAQVIVLLGECWRESLESVRGLGAGLVLVANGTPEDLQCASKEGIHAFIHADDGVLELARAIGAAARADDYCSHTLLPALLEALRRDVNVDGYANQGLSYSLSARELEIGGLVAAGLSNREIAGRLNLSVATVKFHLVSAYRKTGSRGRGDLGARLALHQE